MGTRKQRSPTLAHVHLTAEDVAAITLTPPHDPRTETPEYERAHHFLIYTKNAPCEICGVTRRTLSNPKRNPFGAKALESHHYPIERSLATACDPRKVHRDFPQVYDMATLLAFVDSPANLRVYCDVHHRSVQYGIHHLLPADFVVQRYLRAGYKIAASRKDAANVEASDEQIMQAAGLETAGDTPPAA